MMGDHTECIQIDFDPSLISYEEIIQFFWGNHNPLLGQDYDGRQYMSLLLYHNQAQKELAEKTMKEWQTKLAGEIQTEVTPLTSFYLAEDYHQKYFLKRYKNAVEKLKTVFTTKEAFTNATIVARLNGIVHGYGSIAKLKLDINDWELPLENKAELKDLLEKLRW